MAPRPINPPPGWARDGNNYIRANFQPIPGKNWFQYSIDPVNGNRIVYAIGPQMSTGLTNQVTGQSFDIGGFRKEVMSVDANGRVTKLKYYDEASNAFGAPGLERIKASSREAATKAISQTNVATPATQQSKEYKAPLENIKKQEEKTEITSSTSQKDLLSNKSIQDNPNNSKFKFDGAGGGSPLSYPINRDPKQDYIKFLMYEFSPKSFLGESGVGFGDRLASRGDAKNIVGSVTLPIQPTISDSNVVNWNEDVMSWQDTMFSKISLGTILGGVEGAEQQTQNLANDAQKNSEGYKTAVATSLAQAATGPNKGLLTRTTGAIINPNAELLFQGPGLRSFTFTFTLSAREEKEAIAIRKIIRFFKQGMAVKRASSNLFLKSPNTFGIKYMYGTSEHPWINKIKECALQNFSVNYTPSGNYATYPDGAMTSYELTMSFGELDPIYFDDYTGSDEIGY